MQRRSRARTAPVSEAPDVAEIVTAAVNAALAPVLAELAEIKRLLGSGKTEAVSYDPADWPGWHPERLELCKRAGWNPAVFPPEFRSEPLPKSR